jgi:MFS family permease
MTRETDVTESFPPVVERPISRSGSPAIVNTARRLLERLTPYWTLTVVSLFSITAAIDAGQMPLLVNQIRHDLHVSDIQMSFILGFGTTIITNLLLMPAGWLADRFSRKIIFALSAVAWSIGATTSGFVNGFWTLFGARAGLSGAEATLYPTAHSMLRDAFPPKERGMPFSIFWAAQAIGASISLVFGGMLLTWGNAGVFHGWPIIGGFKSWQVVLAVPGLCTLPLAVLMMTVKEPVRITEHVEGEVVEKGSVREFVTHVYKQWPLFWPSFAYSFFWALQAYGVIAWQPTALARGWGIPTDELGKITGMIGVPATLAGLLVGGWLVDQLGKRGVGDGAIKVCLVFSVMWGIFQIAVYYVGTPFLVYTCIGIAMFFSGTINASYYVAVSFVTPGRLMGQMISLQFLCLNVPYAFSPVLMAYIAQTYFSRMGSLSIIPGLKVVLISCTIVYLLFLALWTYRVGKFAKIHPDGAL